MTTSSVEIVQKKKTNITKFQAFQSGLVDSFSIWNAGIFLVTSASVRRYVLRCSILNILIFSGSIFFTNNIFFPLIRKILDPTQFADLLTILFYCLYQILWLYPIYCISFLFNSLWYQYIADCAWIVRGGKPLRSSFEWKTWIKEISIDVYRLLLIGHYFIEITLISLVPLIGSIIWAVHLCWLYSFFSFEYRWKLEGWTLDQRVSYFEKHWPYFLGFGVPSALLTVFFPSFISYGIFAVIFPTFIILAIVSHPVQHTVAQPYEGLHVFGYAKTMNLMVLRYVKQFSSHDKIDDDKKEKIEKNE